MPGSPPHANVSQKQLLSFRLPQTIVFGLGMPYIRGITGATTPFFSSGTGLRKWFSIKNTMIMIICLGQAFFLGESVIFLGKMVLGWTHYAKFHLPTMLRF